MDKRQLQQIEAKAAIQFQILEAKNEYHRLREGIAALAIAASDKQVLMDALTERYHQITEQLIVKELLISSHRC